MAVGAVLLYHAGLSWFCGGVSLRRSYARRAKRLLPSLAAALYVVNWRFAQ